MATDTPSAIALARDAHVFTYRLVMNLSVGSAGPTLEERTRSNDVAVPSDRLRNALRPETSSSRTDAEQHRVVVDNDPRPLLPDQQTVAGSRTDAARNCQPSRALRTYAVGVSSPFLDEKSWQ